jgi:exodeoxyribonuclease VIII
MSAATVPASKELSMWFERAKSAYTVVGDALKENFRDDEGNLKEGIYFGMPNDVYHSLNALSSTEVKTFVGSPTEYAQQYVFGKEVTRTSSQRKTLETGSLIHLYTLEPARFAKEYFRLPKASEYPDALHTHEQLNQALSECGATMSEGVKDKVNRLKRCCPGVSTKGIYNQTDADAALVRNGLSKSESKLDKGYRLLANDRNVTVFDVEVERLKLSYGQPEVKTIDGEQVTTYGGLVPIAGDIWDSVVRAAEAASLHTDARSVLMDGFAEVAMIVRCKLTGLLMKAKFDWLTIWDTAADVKSTRDTVVRKFKSQVDDLHYDVQEQFYTYVAEMLGVFIKQFTFVAIEFQKAVNCQPFVLKQQRKAKARSVLIDAIQSIARRTKDNNWLNNFESPVTLAI